MSVPTMRRVRATILPGAEEFWRALSMENPDSISYRWTHPVTPVRFVQMQKVAAEIADKRRHNLPLIPEPKFIRTDTEPNNRSRQRVFTNGVRRSLNALFGLAELLELRKRLVGGISALLLRRVDELIEMPAIENGDAIFAAAILLADVARIRPYADHIALFLAAARSMGSLMYASRTLVGSSSMVVIVIRILILVVGRENIGIFLRRFAGATNRRQEPKQTESRAGTLLTQAWVRHTSGHSTSPHRRLFNRA